MSDIINTKPDLSMKPDLGTKKKAPEQEKEAAKKTEKTAPAKSESEADMKESAFGKALESRFLNDADRAILVRPAPRLCLRRRKGRLRLNPGPGAVRRRRSW